VQKELILYADNIQIINYNFIFKNIIEEAFLNDLHRYKLVAIKNSTMKKKLFVHNSIYSLCEYLLSLEKAGKQIIFFHLESCLSGAIAEFIDRDVLIKYFNFLFKKIDKLLPIRTYVSLHSFECLKHVLAKKNGFSKDFINEFKNIVNSKNFEKFTFEKCQSFVKKEGLTFLNKTYFNSFKTKQLLIN